MINKETQVLVMCSAGGRSMIAANLLEKEGLQRSRNRDTSDAKFQMRPND